MIISQKRFYNTSMVDRDIRPTLLDLATQYPAVLITGPRQSGKTTLAQQTFPDKPYVSLEDPDLLLLATEDPRRFLERYEDGAIFDEAQRCPHLFSYLQGIIDEDPRPGRFIVTCSQQFGLMSRVTQSLAGRVALLHLLPFTRKESASIHLFGDQATLDETLFCGFYPRIHDRKLTPQTWYGNYIQTYVERDARQMVNIQDLNSFQRFLRLCAGRIGQLVNLSGLASDCGITHNTAKAWLSILQASYIVFTLQPHYRNFNKRLIKSPKLYFYDVGLASWLLAIRDPDQLSVHSMRGHLFECFVISEALKCRHNAGLPPDLFFWRDRIGNEVDLLLEMGEKLHPVEIKSGQTLNPDFFSGLHRWLNMASDVAVDPCLVYGGGEELTHKEIKVLPWREAHRAVLI